MKVEMLGTSFTLQSDEDPVYLEQVTRFYESKIEEIRDSVETRDPVKLAILAGILVVDDLFKSGAAGQPRLQPSPAGEIARESAGNEPNVPTDALVDNSELEEAERITMNLIHRISSTLEEAAIDAPLSIPGTVED